MFVGGVAAGTLAMTASENGGRYEVRGEARSRGLVGAFAPLTVQAAANGRVSGNDYRPNGYTERVEGRDGTKRKRIAYRGGVPAVTEEPPDDDRKSWYADAAGQGGTLDPVTIVWGLLRDRPPALACRLDAASYDGQRRSRIRLSESRAEGDRLTCSGRYTREAGYSRKELAEQRHWDFTISYRRDGELYRVEEMRLPLSLGTMVFARR